MFYSSEKKLTPFAGGTDLIVLLEAGKLPPGEYLNINGLQELKKITSRHLRIKVLEI